MKTSSRHRTSKDLRQHMRQLEIEVTYWKKRAMYDPMTGVHSKEEGLRQLEAAIHQCHVRKGSLTICFIDIDGLKKINDQYGHCQGDRVIRDVSRIIRKSIRREDIMFRFGGDEFVVIFKHTTKQEAQANWQRVRTNIKKFNLRNYPDIPVDLSTGFIEHCKVQGTTSTTLIHAADQAMYQEKNNKKQRL